MKKACVYCDNLFKDLDNIVVVYDGTYKDIPSQVCFSVSAPQDIREMFHPECYAAATEER